MNNTITKEELEQLVEQINPLVNSLQQLESWFLSNHYFYSAYTIHSAWSNLCEVMGVSKGYIETLTNEYDENHS